MMVSTASSSLRTTLGLSSRTKINLLEKSYFDFELEPTYIYAICIANIIVAGYLTYKGIKIAFGL